MIQLQLNDEEMTVLLQTLDSCISDLRTEIHDTDNFNYKLMLKRRKEVLAKLQEALVCEQQTQAMT